MTRDASERTVSERLFEALCVAHAVACEAIPRASSRTADYRLRIGGGVVVAEVKQMDPGPEDVRIARDLATRGRARAMLAPGARVRQEITDSRKQLRTQAKGRYPALLVLYDNTAGRTGAIAPHDVLVAMYGEERIEYAVFSGSADNRPPELPPDRFVVGGNRGVDRAANTTLSAVAVLTWFGEAVGLDVYHSCFAALPFDPAWLRGYGVRHYAVAPPEAGSFREWVPA
jgi:hypothetical protein